jgi:hypothetical protein
MEFALHGSDPHPVTAEDLEPDAVDNQVAPMLSIGERERTAPIRAFDILPRDQGQFAAIGLGPVTLAEGIAVTLDAPARQTVRLTESMHGLAGSGRDKDVDQAPATLITPPGVEPGEQQA